MIKKLTIAERKMKEKLTRPYLPEVSAEEIKAFEASRPETHTKIRLVNETIEALDRLGYSINNDVPGYLGLTQVELSHALKVLTGLTLTEIKHLLLPLRLDALRSSHPDLNPDQLAHRLGFADRTALLRIIDREEYDRKLAKHGKRDV